MPQPKKPPQPGRKPKSNKKDLKRQRKKSERLINQKHQRQRSKLQSLHLHIQRPYPQLRQKALITQFLSNKRQSQPQLKKKRLKSKKQPRLRQLQSRRR